MFTYEILYKTGLLSAGVGGHRVAGARRGEGHGRDGLSDVEDSVDEAEEAPAATLCVERFPEEAAAAAATLDSTDDRGDAKLVGGWEPPNVRE